MELVIFKKKTLDNIKRECPKMSISDLFSNYLYAFLHPECYKIPENEEGRWICSEETDIFEDFFNAKIDNGETIIIDEKIYAKMYKWLEKKLKTITLYDFIYDKNYEEHIHSIICVYKNMSNIVVDFENEVVLFCHER